MIHASKYLTFIAVCLAFCFYSGDAFAASGGPVELVGDTIEYDSAQGIMTAQGNVRLTQDGAVMTGTNAQYDTKNKEALITGGVHYTKEDLSLTAFQVRSYQDTHLVADGDAVLTKGANTLQGPQIEYYSDRQYALVNGAGRLEMPDATMTANRLEAYLGEDKGVGTGNVHIVGTTRNLDAVSEQAVYYGIKGEVPGKIVLTGSPRVVQDGNVLTGNTMTIYLDEKSMDAQGRSKLIVKPQQ
ncbi:MAG: OstA family protein [Firmicutes bacterium]|nr:OstA family protein [Bacillota bacterium]